MAGGRHRARYGNRREPDIRADNSSAGALPMGDVTIAAPVHLPPASGAAQVASGYVADTELLREDLRHEVAQARLEDRR
ncbi:hypothetical protein TR51_01810 [Kitasatospora griseola]|uniref:Uncharacterized protein n=1 Tax=Kitasatospora griseola TaxID=2064 RepID=A0A0D0PV21_KITGR|nr:hypothetical protein TR51_01810 [Kitasatospora griseola]